MRQDQLNQAIQFNENLEYSSYHVLICLKCDFKDVSLFSLCQEEKHGLGLVSGATHKDHTSLRVVQIVL